jgi:uncharacterized protein YbjT (DUF2867 family)
LTAALPGLSLAARRGGGSGEGLAAPGEGEDMAGQAYVVTGATGNVGGIVAERLVEAGEKVRVVGRDAARLERFTRRGAEPAVGSLEDPRFVREAVAGAGAVFAMIPPKLAPGYREFQRRVVAALGDAIEAARPAHVLTLSSQGADRAQGTGPIVGVHELEARLDRIAGTSVLHLRPGYFLENHLAAIDLVRTAGIVAYAIRAELPFVQVAARDVGEVAARRMAALDWSGREVHELHGAREVTMGEVSAALWRAIGRPELRYVQLSYEDATRGLAGAGVPPDLAELYTELARALNEGLVDPRQPRSAATTTPTTAERWAEEVFAPAYRAR